MTSIRSQRRIRAIAIAVLAVTVPAGAQAGAKAAPKAGAKADASAGARAPAQADEIAGRWRGTSICVKADWNSACNDEQIVYYFERTDSPTRVIQHAYKYVGTTLELMGDLPTTYDAPTKSWVAPFSNTRVSILWRYRVEPGGRLTGTVVRLDTNRIGRNVEAKRDSIQTPPPEDSRR